jgi:hypothetical protein
MFYNEIDTSSSSFFSSSIYSESASRVSSSLLIVSCIAKRATSGFVLLGIINLRLDEEVISG